MKLFFWKVVAIISFLALCLFFYCFIQIFKYDYCYNDFTYEKDRIIYRIDKMTGEVFWQKYNNGWKKL